MTVFSMFTEPTAALPLLYIDPGAGSIILQALLAGTAGAFVFFKYHGRRVASFLGLKRTEQGPDRLEGE